MFPIIFTSFCKKHNRLSIKGKNFSKYCNVMKMLGRGSNYPLPLYCGGGVSLRVRPRVNLSSTCGGLGKELMNVWNVSCSALFHSLKLFFFVYFSQFYYVNFPATSFYENRMLRVFTHRMSYCSTVTFIIGRCKPGVLFALISYFFLCFSLLDMEACKIRIRCILSALLTWEKKGLYQNKVTASLASTQRLGY